MTNWIEVKAHFDEAPADWSVFVDAFERFGCPGTLQTDRPATLGGYLVEVSGADERAQQLSDELKRLGAGNVTTAVVPEENWAELWKQHFKPRRIGRRLVVRPTWEEYSAEPGDIEIVLDPGQAFGTGDHPTTRLCLALLEAAELYGKTVADVGCGSGILAVAAVKLGAARVTATDIDPQAVEVSKLNAELNGVRFDCYAADGFVGLAGEPYDVVVSNIISATLIRIAADAAAHMNEGGLWVVSGIYHGNWPDVRAAAEAQGLTFVEQRQEDDWIAAIFRR